MREQQLLDQDKTSVSSVNVAVHGHFYQSPREDPFTGIIPKEPGAAPYCNFNERITAECYRPNAELGNFDLMSFDMGPTLTAWLEVVAPHSCASMHGNDPSVGPKGRRLDTCQGNHRPADCWKESRK